MIAKANTKPPVINHANQVLISPELLAPCRVRWSLTASHLMALGVPYDDFNAVTRFEIINEEFEDFLDPYCNVHISDATQGNLRQIDLHPGGAMQFNYDFGDDWRINLTLEEVFEDKELPGNSLPCVLDGAGFGIVEDCGGIGGLEELVQAYKKKKGAAYKECCEWLGIDSFDITAFDLTDMNFRLKKIPCIYKQCYEDRLPPTQRSIDLIERKYLKK